MAHRGYREASKINWGRDESENLTFEQINLGCMLRIADAVEKLAKPYLEMLDQARVERDRRIQAEGQTKRYRTWVKRLKNQMKKRKSE